MKSHLKHKFKVRMMWVVRLELKRKSAASGKLLNNGNYLS